VRNKGSKEKGIKIKSATKEGMQLAAKQYGKNKDVVILGKYSQDAWVTE
jgi:hypothetical protein